MDKSGWTLFWAILFFVGILIGWVINLIALVGVETLNGEALARLVGVFVPPLGAIFGYFL